MSGPDSDSPGTKSASSALASGNKEADRERIGREVEGTWLGQFTIWDRGYLNITTDGDAIRGVLVVGHAQAVYQGRFVDRALSGGNSAALLLTPIRQTGDLGARKDNHLYTPVYVAPSHNGDTLDWRTASKNLREPELVLRRFTETGGSGGASMAEMFKERSVSETEFVPVDAIRLYDQLEVAVWDTLNLAEVRTRQLRFFYTGLAVSSSGTEFRHIVVRGPDYEERKAWTR